MVVKRILIADAEATQRESYCRHLAENGFRVAAAASGLECVATLRTFRPHLLVLDLEVPWGRGEGVLAMMYEDFSVPLVPVIALSAQSDPEGLRRVGVFPLSDHQVKPMTAERLLERVRLVFARHYKKTRKRGRVIP